MNPLRLQSELILSMSKGELFSANFTLPMYELWDPKYIRGNLCNSYEFMYIGCQNFVL